MGTITMQYRGFKVTVNPNGKDYYWYARSMTQPTVVVNYTTLMNSATVAIADAIRRIDEHLEKTAPRTSGETPFGIDWPPEMGITKEQHAISALTAAYGHLCGLDDAFTQNGEGNTIARRVERLREALSDNVRRAAFLERLDRLYLYDDLDDLADQIEADVKARRLNHDVIRNVVELLRPFAASMIASGESITTMIGQIEEEHLS